jgi:hypothetical protein
MQRLVHIYLCGLLVLVFLRFGFLAYHSSVIEFSSYRELFSAGVMAFIIDSAVVATTLFGVQVLVLFFQSSAKALKRRGDHSRLAERIIFSLFSLIFLVNIVDVFYFEQFDSRINVMVLDNIGQLGPILGTIWDYYPIYWVVLSWAVSVSLFIFLSRQKVYLRIYPKHWNYRASVFNLVILFGLSFLYIEEPFWRMSSLAPSSQALTQAAQNGVYSFVTNYRLREIRLREGGLISQFEHSSEEFLDWAKRLISSDSDNGSESWSESWVEESRYPFERRIRAPIPLLIEKPNIVLVLLEGFSASNIQSLTPEGTHLSPHFDELAKKGISFRNFYSHETRTHHGLVSVVGGLPSLFGSFITRRVGDGSFYTMGNLLRGWGYDTSFFYGYDAHYDHREFFLRQGGFDTIADLKNFKNPRDLGVWGASDQDVFERANAFYRVQTDRPFFSVILTSTNHAPYRVPSSFLEAYPKFPKEGYEATFKYTDWALGKFMEDARKEDYYENTVFLFVADHGEAVDSKDRILKRFHIPFLIYAPHLMDRQEELDVIGAHADIAPTLLHLIGYPNSFHFLGRNLLELNDDEGFAVMRRGESLMYRYGDRLLIRDPSGTKSTIHQVDDHSYLGKILDETSHEDERRSALQNLERYIKAAFHVFFNGEHRVSN